LYVPKNSVSYYQNIDNMSFDEKQKLKSKTTTVTTTTVTTTTQVVKPFEQFDDKNSNFVYYVVKQGDTLWDIAKLYPGVTGEDICRWNNISANTMITPGQKIKIKVM
jgi:membrane-bound lytic murein transglycosylase D